MNSLNYDTIHTNAPMTYVDLLGTVDIKVKKLLFGNFYTRKAIKSGFSLIDVA